MQILRAHNRRFIYLKTIPEICLERIQLRNRPEELGIPIEYLTALDKKHDLWLNDPDINHPVLTINGDDTTDQIVDKILNSHIVSNV